MFYTYLEEFQKNKKLISIYSEGNSTRFNAGFIQAYNENYFIYISIAPEGKYDGVCLKKNEIVKIEYGGFYEKKLEQLIIANDYKQKQINLEFNNHVDLLEQFLIYIKNNNRILTIELLNSGYDDVNGFIKSMDKEHCSISSINEYGFVDSNAIIRKEDITRISFDSDLEIELETLYTKNYPSNEKINW